MAEQHLRNLLPAPVLKSMEGFFSQARLKLRTSTRAKENAAWLDKVRVVPTTQPLRPPKLREGVFEAVSNALYADHWLDIDYQNVAGKRGTYKVMPLGLVQQGERLSLVCRYDGHSDIRHLALNRFHRATDTGLPFERPKDFDLRHHDEEEQRFGFGRGERIELVFRLPKTTGFFITESHLSSDQKVREIGDRYEFRATVVKSLQLRQWLRGFGPELELVSPAGLLDAPAPKG
jgi:predicted DNA-binding transcriptional regulator YafY